MTRFFVSYNRADKGWAEWIAWTLEAAGHETVIQAWDFRPGGNFVLDMQRASAETDKTILVLSENYLASEFTQPEWASAFAGDPTSLERRLIPVRVQVCEPRGLLRSIVYVDLIGVEKEVAQQRLLDALPERLKPESEPDFPRGKGGLGKEEFHGDSSRGGEQPDFPNPAVSKPWNVPYDRNAFFTGRETVLADLRSQLMDGGAAAIAQAISGLGGIGKTQTAVEYAYRHRDDYSAVFWVRAETVAETQTGFVEIARSLDLPEKATKDPNDTVQAVRRWLEGNAGWLLVFDNADQPAQLKDFRPRQGQGSQHILLTSRAQTFDSLGIARPVSLAKMPAEEAVAFLFKRTGRNIDIEENSAEKIAAAALARELGYLPLALEQAGAYLLAQQMTFTNYLKSYRKRKLALLAQKGPVAGDYPESVATTWALNFQEVEAASQAAADLLRVSAFLSPDAIPYELFALGAWALGDALATALGDMAEDPAAFAEVLVPLTRYSLVRVEPTMQAYSVARMVQEVQKAALTQEDRRRWVGRDIEAVNKAFPTTDYKNWPLIERLVTHSRLLVQLVNVYQIEAEAASSLLNKTGAYLYTRGLYDEAEPLYLKALKIEKQSLEKTPPFIICTYSRNMTLYSTNLANLYCDQDRYSDAEPLYLQALESSQRIFGEDHTNDDVAAQLTNLANLYRAQGRYNEAEPLFLKALEHYSYSSSCSLVEFPPEVATMLNCLALLYSDQGRYSDAEPIFLQSLEIGKRSLGEDHPAIATRLNNLALLYKEQGRYSEAEQLSRQGLIILEKTLGAEHPNYRAGQENLQGILAQIKKLK